MKLDKQIEVSLIKKELKMYLNEIGMLNNPYNNRKDEITYITKLMRIVASEAKRLRDAR